MDRHQFKTVGPQFTTPDLGELTKEWVQMPKADSGLSLETRRGEGARASSRGN